MQAYLEDARAATSSNSSIENPTPLSPRGSSGLASPPNAKERDTLLHLLSARGAAERAAANGHPQIPPTPVASPSKRAGSAGAAGVAPRDARSVRAAVVPSPASSEPRLQAESHRSAPQQEPHSSGSLALRHAGSGAGASYGSVRTAATRCDPQCQAPSRFQVRTRSAARF